jgi:hypothetical protein
MGDQSFKSRIAVEGLQIGVFSDFYRPAGKQSVVDGFLQQRKRLIASAALGRQDPQVVYRDSGLGLVGAKNTALKLKHLAE